MGTGYSPLHKGNIYAAENFKVAQDWSKTNWEALGRGRFVVAMKLRTKQRLGFGCLLLGIFLTDFSIFQSLITRNKESLNVDF